MHSIREMKTGDALLVSVTLSGTILSYAYFNHTAMVLCLVVTVLLILYIFGLKTKICLHNNVVSASIIIIAVMLMMSPIALYGSIYSIYFIASSVFGIILANLVSNRPYIASRVLRWTLLSMQLPILVYILVNIDENRFPLETILSGANSSNVVTSFLILLQATYIAALFVGENKSAYATTLFTVVICTVGYGRGSFIASIMLLIIVLGQLTMMKFFKSEYYRVFFILFVIFLALSGIFFGNDIVNLLVNNTKIVNGFVDPHRLRMISDYISNLDAFSVLFGGSYEGTSIASDFGGNPHNSFIRAHHLLGIWYLAALVLVSFVAVFLAGSLGRSLLMVSLLFVVVFRAFSEPIIFPTPLDFYYTLILFLFMQKPNNCFEIQAQHR